MTNNGLDAGWGWVNRRTYTEGDTFLFRLDKEGIAAVEFYEWTSSVAGSDGAVLDKVDADTFTFTGKDGQFFNLATLADYVAAGYTKITITAKYTSGQLWIGNNVWSGEGAGMQGLNNGDTKVVDITDLAKFVVYCSGAVADAEITYTFSK